MRSMFVKLFLSFWLILILGGAVSVTIFFTFHNHSIELFKKDMAEKFDNNLAKLIVLSGRAAQEIYICGGKTEYKNYINGLVEGAHTRIFLIGDDNRTITGAEVSNELLKLAEKARKNTEVSIQKSGDILTVSKSLGTNNSKSTVVIGVHTIGPPPGMPSEGKDWPFFAGFPPPFFARGEMIRTAIMLIMVSGVCYVLARSLTIPIRKLQKTAQQIAGGDYTVRVGQILGRTGNEIADLGRDFDIMVDRTETLISSQKRLLRDISHELRSPLARLNVALALAKKRLDAEEDSSLNKIGHEADRLNELIGQLLTLTRLESGAGIPTAAEPVKLNKLLSEVAKDVDFEATGNGRGVRIVSSQEITVTGSRELLRRAIENIVRNAAHYTAKSTMVDISLSTRGKEVKITVTDSGPGVPQQDLPHLFEPFYRVAKARERQTGGMGIGLAIAEQAIKAHKGSVIVQNRIDREGLIVYITLPLQTTGGR
jgi:signal transduction histidine kinase